MTRGGLVVLTVAAALVLAGCVGSPNGGTETSVGERSFTIEATGNSTQSLLVTVHLYETPPEDLTLEYANGSTRSFQVPVSQGLVQGDSPPELRRVDGPAPDGGVVFEGAPSFTATDERIAPTRTAVFVVRVDGSDRVAAWGIAVCDAHVDRVTLDADGANVTVGGLACGG